MSNPRLQGASLIRAFIILVTVHEGEASLAYSGLNGPTLSMCEFWRRHIYIEGKDLLTFHAQRHPILGGPMSTSSVWFRRPSQMEPWSLSDSIPFIQPHRLLMMLYLPGSPHCTPEMPYHQLFLPSEAKAGALLP